MYLDTHIVVWLYAGLIKKLTDAAKRAIEDHDNVISHFVRLELQYLYEIDRIRAKPDTIINSLSNAIGLKTSDVPLSMIIEQAFKIRWTRDVFDRLLVAESKTGGYGLVTADKTIRSNFKHAIW